MKYYIRSTAHTSMLIQVTLTAARELRAAGYHLSPVSGQEAHRWVRRGGNHETPLWIDDENRVRYARDNS